MTAGLQTLLQNVRACTLCKDDLPFGPRPILQAHQNAKVLIAGQAPGSRVHESGVPFDDPSGDRLRDWMGIDKATFYDETKIAILPIGFCYPGTGKSGDLPPLRRCAETWRQELLDSLPNIQLTLLIGQYAQKWHLDEPRRNLTETVRAWSDFGDAIIPLPHPSPRNNIWLKKNPWFSKDVLPAVAERVQHALAS